MIFCLGVSLILIASMWNNYLRLKPYCWMDKTVEWMGIVGIFCIITSFAILAIRYLP